MRKKLGCIGALVVSGLLLVYVIFPLFQSGFGMADTRSLPGDAARFDPIAALPDVRAYAGEGVQLTSIDATYVRSDGTLDLTISSYYPSVTYEFVRQLDAPPPDAPPIGAGGSVDGLWFEPVEIRAYQPGQWRSVTRTGGGVRTSYSYMNRGMQRETGDPTTSPDPAISDPACSFAELWRVALQRDAPESAVAIIDYESDGYTFSISDISLHLEFTQDCKPRE
jgi:hypothetical protein